MTDRVPLPSWRAPPAVLPSLPCALAPAGDLNQYWYSAHTIEVMVGEVVANSKRCAFLSTPSIFFSIKDRKLRGACTLFDLDEQWTDLPNYVIYDYREPDKIPEELCGTFDYCVIDPPFITHEVWAFYAVAAKKLLAKGGKILGTTIPENADFLREQLGMEPRCACEGDVAIRLEMQTD